MCGQSHVCTQGFPELIQSIITHVINTHVDIIVSGAWLYAQALFISEVLIVAQAQSQAQALAERCLFLNMLTKGWLRPRRPQGPDSRQSGYRLDHAADGELRGIALAAGREPLEAAALQGPGRGGQAARRLSVARVLPTARKRLAAWHQSTVLARPCLPLPQSLRHWPM